MSAARMRSLRNRLLARSPYSLLSMFKHSSLRDSPRTRRPGHIINPGYTTVKIRTATSEDIDELMKLERASHTAAHWTLRQYRDLFEAQPAMLVLVGVADDGGMLGFLVARHVAGEWELENIIVSTTERRKGVGTRLIQRLVEAARQEAAKSIFLEVRESNEAARRFYEQTGFRQNGVRKHYYVDPAENAILYELELK